MPEKLRDDRKRFGENAGKVPETSEGFWKLLEPSRTFWNLPEEEPSRSFWNLPEKSGLPTWVRPKWDSHMGLHGPKWGLRRGIGFSLLLGKGRPNPTPTPAVAGRPSPYIQRGGAPL